jgi:membrane associated rhomboid family serine protease
VLVAASNAPLSIIRLDRKTSRAEVVASGSLEELVEVAREGGLQPHDRIAGVDPPRLVLLHTVPSLGRFVPSPEEASVARSLRTLLVLGALGALLFAFSGGFGLLADGLESRNLWFVLALFVVLFVVPLVQLLRERRRLGALRRNGEPNLAVPLTAADRALLTLVSHRAPVARLLVIALVVAYVTALLLPEQQLDLRFAKINERIREGEIWRLVTMMFVHAGLMHLFFNTSALSEFGRTVENLYGPRRFLAIFFGAGIAGAVASFLATPTPSVGASGGIFGLIGALLAFGLRHRPSLPAAARQRFTIQMGLCLAVNLGLGLLSTFIDNAAHLGGLVGGALIASWVGVSPAVTAMLERAPAPKLSEADDRGS